MALSVKLQSLPNFHEPTLPITVFKCTRYAHSLRLDFSTSSASSLKKMFRKINLHSSERRKSMEPTSKGIVFPSQIRWCIRQLCHGRCSSDISLQSKRWSAFRWTNHFAQKVAHPVQPHSFEGFHCGSALSAKHHKSNDCVPEFFSHVGFHKNRQFEILWANGGADLPQPRKKTHNIKKACCARNRKHASPQHFCDMQEAEESGSQQPGKSLLRQGQNNMWYQELASNSLASPLVSALVEPSFPSCVELVSPALRLIRFGVSRSLGCERKQDKAVNSRILTRTSTSSHNNMTTTSAPASRTGCGHGRDALLPQSRHAPRKLIWASAHGAMPRDGVQARERERCGASRSWITWKMLKCCCTASFTSVSCLHLLV